MKLIKFFLILGLVLNTQLALGDASAVVTEVPPVKNFAVPATPGLGVAEREADACNTALGKASPTRLQLNAAAKTAGTWCLAQSNPNIHQGIVVVGGLLSGIAMMKSMKDSCSKFNDAMKAGQLALTAYNTSCSIVQSQCDTAVAVFRADLTAAKTACKSAPNVTGEINSITETALAKIAAQCSGYKTSMMAAGTGIMSMLQQSGLMGKCEQATAAVDCTKDPTNAQCPQSIDCTNPTNATNAVCICKANPLAAGCGSSTAPTGAPTGVGTPTAVTTPGAFDPGTFNGGGASDGVISPTGAKAAGGGSSLGGGSGGGSGGGGGVGGGSGSAKAADATKRTGLNGNILGGYEGGGGGGGGGGRSGSGINSGLKDFLPGGAKDPNRNIAAQGLNSKEVTASGSKSNWEKVTDRYQDNKRTLMGP